VKLLEEKSLFLSSTDTTIGFLSQSAQSLDLAKRRRNKKYIKVFDSFETLKRVYRTPKVHRKFIRRAEKITFILSNSFSFRVVKEKKHLLLLNRLKWLYSTSANITGEVYDAKYAKNRADIIVYPIKRLSEPSKIYKLSRNERIKRVR
jgi:tRNA A37 threonylcarbamoyladenosine synthetase subunit TsaC/SUA5/YrdC